MPDPALARLTPPPDPRTEWDLPALGGLPHVADLDEVTTRVLAPNPSPMTLDGTDTYVLGLPGSGSAVVVDPGPDDAGHLAAVTAVLADRDAACELVLVTHHHHDHAEAAAGWARRFGASLVATTPEVAGSPGRVVAAGQRLTAGGLTLEAVPTPGHTADHVAYRLETGALLTGDHVLGRGTSVVALPDGDLVSYLESVRRVLDLGPDALYPGHGPALTTDPGSVLRYYLDHRAFREQQVLASLADGPATASALVRRIYAEVDPLLWPAAEASTVATLVKLESEDRVAWDGQQAALMP